MADDPKALRTKHKTAVTKQISLIQQRIAEDNESAVEQCVTKLKDLFSAFTEAHEACHSVLQTPAEISNSDYYYSEVQDRYIQALTDTKTWLKPAEPPSISDEHVSSFAGSDGKGLVETSDVVRLLNLPKVELEVFDGDPVKYHSFIAVFDESVHKVNLDDQVKLTRLLQYTTGKAKDAIRSCVLAGGSGYSEARDILQKRFGNKHLVAERYLRNIRNGKPVRTADELQHFSDELSDCYTTFKQLNELREVDSQNTIVEILGRLQPYIRNRWKKLALESKRDHDSYPKFKDFVDFVKQQAEDATDPVYGNLSIKQKWHHKSEYASFSSSVPVSQSSNGSSSSGSNSSVCILCKDKHRLWSCKLFREKKPVERLQLVKQHKLCENCLLPNHITAHCKKPSVCGVPGCGGKHTKFIHVNPNSDSNSQGTSGTQISSFSTSSDDICLPVVAVVVNDSYNTCAMLDTCSTCSFCSQSLVTALGLKGSKVTYSLSTVSQLDETRESQVVDFNIKSVDGKESLWLRNVHVVDKVPVSNPSVDVQHYDHLQDLSLSQGESGVDLLIGQDNSEALLPLEVRKGRTGQPFAVRTLLGWVLNGPVNTSCQISQMVISNFISTTVLEDKVDRLWKIENDGFEVDECESVLDQSVLMLWDKNIRSVDGHYELPIPWKDKAVVPNNLSVARSRLNSLSVSLNKRGLYKRYDEEVDKLLEKQYAEIVPPEQVESCDPAAKVWYLPHHAVVTEKKPDKLRIVFDCAARFQGESLNDKCLQGPDLNNKLLHVLLRFRQFQFSVMADIEGMYMQVLIPEKERDVLRFLWYSKEGNIVTYRMTRHIFGGVWCSSSSTFALRRVLQDNEGVDPLVRDTIRRSFYVDDMLSSVPSEDEASMIIHETKELLKCGGFNLTKFVTNSEKLLLSIQEEDRAKEVKEFQSEISSKALGVKWCVTSDELCFQVEVKAHKHVTRRTMLSVIASVYDPLGLVVPCIIEGKVLFQTATRLKLSWDDSVPEQLERQWNSWLDSLQDLTKFKISRCLVGKDFVDASVELHHFSDSSEKAYGCCSYLRAINSRGQVHVALVCSRGRITPIKVSQTIPRLEMQAAVLSAQMDHMLRQQMDLTFIESHFWVDSELVLQYIQNESLRLKVYVANRVSLIRSISRPSQWHHIPGSENPADRISRGQSPDSLAASSWAVGPSFLLQYKSEWIVNSCRNPLSVNNPEVRKSEFVSAIMDEDKSPTDMFLDYFSDWYKLKRSVAWLLRVKDKLRKVTQYTDKYLSVSELSRAETSLIRLVQSRSYSQEISDLSRGHNVRKSSKVVSLSPILDTDGILRVGGRLAYSHLSKDARNPCLIPQGHVASLIALHWHNVAHLGTEWVVSLIRRKYWVVKCRQVVKKVSESCMVCRRCFGEPLSQRMSDLPSCRLEPDQPPFTFVGTDCFGPFLVKRGRVEVKRYGCIFSCLTTRAIHLEKLDSLETDSFLNGFRRFVARRGYPETVYSDNGTNFVGGRTELNSSLKNANQDLLRAYGLKKEINWVFNPPTASHMGGSWERLIRTVRKVLTGVLHDSRATLTDDMLMTLFCEVEFIVNGRPLTKVSDDPNDPSPLTPNHLLLLREVPNVEPGKFVEADVYRKRWRCVQSLASQFWHRWLKEYVPELQRRNKWHDTKRNVKQGDLVLLMVENTPRGLWPMGIVEEVKLSKDGLARSATIRTRSTTLVRPITKVVLLEGRDI